MRKMKFISKLGCLGLAACLMGQPLLVAVADGDIGGGSLAGISAVLEEYINTKEDAEETIYEFVSSETPIVGISLYNNFAISKVEEYVNVREEPSVESEILGKIYDQCGATILSTTTQEDGDWYHIKSGTVDGYVKAEFFVTGLEAKDYAKANGNLYLKVLVDGINIREKPNTDCDILAVVTDEDGKKISVIGEEDNFLKVRLKDGKIGYASKEFSDVYINCDTAISLEEEKAMLEELARQAAEEAARIERERKAAEEASRAAAEAAWLEYLAEQQASREAAEAAWLEYLAEQQASREAEEAAWAAYQAQLAWEEQQRQEEEARQRAAWEAQQAAYEAQLQAELEAQRQAAWEAQQQATWEDDEEDWEPEQEQYNEPQPSYQPTYTLSAARSAVVEYCYSKLGCDYVWGAEGPWAFDCSGLVKKAYEQAGVYLYHQSGVQGQEGSYASLENAQPGDILWKSGHVGIYVGNGLCIHASTYGVGVIVSGLYDVGWVCARNVLG